MPTAQLLRTIRVEYPPRKIAISPDNRTIVGLTNGELALWSIETGKLKRIFREDPTPPVQRRQKLEVKAFSFAPDGRVVAGTIREGRDGTRVVFWDPRTGKLDRSFKVPMKSPVRSLVYSPDGRFIALGSSADPVRLFWARTGKPFRTVTRMADHSDPEMAFSPDSGCVVIAYEELNGQRDQLGLWDLRDGSRKWIRSIGQRYVHCPVAFSPSGDVVATGGDSPRLWDSSGGRLVRSLAATETTPVQTGSMWATSLAFSPKGDVLAAGGWATAVPYHPGRLYLWNVQNGELILSLVRGPDELLVYSVAYSPDGRLLACAGDLGIRIWRLELGRQQAIGDGKRLLSLQLSGGW